MKKVVSKTGIIQDKQSFKKSQGKCRICGNKIYSTLDIHRIKPGAENGQYFSTNSTVLCGNCHRRVHAGEIVIDRYYQSTSGKKMLRIIRNGKEEFV